MQHKMDFMISRKLGLFFIMFSLVFLLVGGVSTMTVLDLRRNCTYDVTGIVVDNMIKRSTDRSNSMTGYTYAPLFEFEYDGHTYQAGSNVSTDPPRYKIGQPVPLKINPDDPYQIRETGSSADIILCAMAFLIGIASMSAGIVFYRKYRIATRDRKYWRYD